GRYWIGMTDTQKTFYVQGIGDGFATAATLVDADTRQMLLRTPAEGFVVDDYLNEFNKVYADRENVSIPVPGAYLYCSLKLKGTQTKDDLERRLIEMRKSFKF